MYPTWLFLFQITVEMHKTANYKGTHTERESTMSHNAMAKSLKIVSSFTTHLVKIRFFFTVPFLRVLESNHYLGILGKARGFGWCWEFYRCSWYWGGRDLNSEEKKEMALSSRPWVFWEVCGKACSMRVRKDRQMHISVVDDILTRVVIWTHLVLVWHSLIIFIPVFFF